MRARKKKWADHEINENKHIIQDAENLQGNWNQYFNNTHPIHLELGCGKGRFISQMSLLYPAINYIGFEKEKMIIAAAARKLGSDFPNVGLIHGDIENILSYFKQGEIQRLYINFCDPWPKSRHAKRRLTNRIFLEKYKMLFQSRCEIFFKTDNESLFDFSLEEFRDNGWSLENVTRDLHRDGLKDNVMTEYEEKFSSKGLPIYRLEAYFTK